MIKFKKLRLLDEPVEQLFMGLPTFYGTWRFNTVSMMDFH
jgi:hypothetical protein